MGMTASCPTNMISKHYNQTIKTTKNKNETLRLTRSAQKPQLQSTYQLQTLRVSRAPLRWVFAMVQA